MPGAKDWGARRCFEANVNRCEAALLWMPESDSRRGALHNAIVHETDVVAGEHAAEPGE